MAIVVLLRHGQSVWNHANRFTGWTDVDLSEQGIAETDQAGQHLLAEGLTFDYTFTSVLKRAIRTLWIVLDQLDLLWIPVERGWQLNERHCGALQGLNKAETAERYGPEQVYEWRRSYAVRPPALEAEDPRHPRFDRRYAGLNPAWLPSTESRFKTLAIVYGPIGSRLLCRRYEPCAEKGATVVWVGWNGRVSGFIALRDLPNPTAREALDQLEAAGIHTVMLSGDDPRTTRAIAKELGIGEYEGDCPPLAKVARIRGWQEGGERVAMVGDGGNDAPALAQADLSITAAGGTDVAGGTSDVVLTHADLTLVPWLIRLSRRTRRIIVQNLGWAFAYNLFSVPLAALGVISPVIAAVTISISSLLVVGNSLRLRH